MIPYKQLDIWETLKAHVVDHAPALAPMLDEARSPAWQSVPPTEAQVLALMAFLDWEPHSAPARRKARRLVRDIAPPPPDESAASSVRETAPEPSVELDGKQRERLAATLAWIEAEPPAKWLAPISGPQAAAAHAARKAKALDGLRAHRWLAFLGYPMAVPDQARQRFLMRMGWIEETSQTKEGRSRALAAIEGLARAVEAPLAEVNLVLAAFTGAGPEAARDAATCLTKPRCQACPIKTHCAYFRYAGKDRENESRNLHATTRKEDRPREKLERDGADGLGEAELIAILLRTGSGRENAVDLAARLLREAGTLDRLAAMSIAEISRVHGLGRVKAITIKAALELARRLGHAPSAAEGSIRTARTVFERLRPRFVGAKKEEFLALLLNTKNEITRIVPISIGTLNQSLVHPREAFTEAIRDTAHAVIFAHNHPSGDPTPSRDDHAVTHRLVKAGDIVGVKVLDHIVIGAENYYSFADEGKLRE